MMKTFEIWMQILDASSQNKSIGVEMRPSMLDVHRCNKALT